MYTPTTYKFNSTYSYKDMAGDPITYVTTIFQQLFRVCIFVETTRKIGKQHFVTSPAGMVTLARTIRTRSKRDSNLVLGKEIVVTKLESGDYTIQ